jgi:hypothetical protein
MKPDANQSEIIGALRAAGASVTILAGVGRGCPDLLVGIRDHNLLMEIKNLEGRGNRLTTEQEAWIKAWKGQVAIVTSIDEALTVLREPRGKAY